MHLSIQKVLAFGLPLSALPVAMGQAAFSSTACVMICPQGTKHVWPACFYSIASCEAQWGGSDAIKAKCEANDEDISKVTHQEYTFPGENAGDDCKDFLDGFLSKTTVGAPAQKDSEVAQAQCGCKELFGAALDQLIDVPAEAAGDSFCDGLIKGFVEKKAKLVCGPLRGLGGLGAYVRTYVALNFKQTPSAHLTVAHFVMFLWTLQPWWQNLPLSQFVVYWSKLLIKLSRLILKKYILGFKRWPKRQQTRLRMRFAGP
ncbi:hypothetical protein BC832DRAFT_302728 [Gaertneriomyces semiglobifer]|nr:hypothetical protein BC832DRAFT_302728 [Gaertneriomyces semiglobifer]